MLTAGSEAISVWSLSQGSARTTRAARVALGIHFFQGGCSVWAGLWACFLETGLLSACPFVSDPSRFP
jgi:hypothetical protein